MTIMKPRTALAAVILAATAILTSQQMASAAAAPTTCVDQNNGRGCTKDEIIELCVPIYMGGKPADPTNPVDKFCRAKHPDELN